MTHETKQVLNKLSKEVFGTSSRWQKLVNKGVAEPMSKDREVMVPTKGGLVKKVFTDHKSVLKHYSVEEVTKLMLDIIQERNAAKAAFESAKEKDTALPTDSTAVSNVESG